MGTMSAKLFGMVVYLGRVVLPCENSSQKREQGSDCGDGSLCPRVHERICWSEDGIAAQICVYCRNEN